VSPVKIIRHRTLESCVAAYLGKSVKNLPRRGYWSCYDRKGRSRRYLMSCTLRKWRKLGCWGWVQHRQRRIHLWIAPHAAFAEVVILLAHELGHLSSKRINRPAGVEERKANLFERVTEKALALAETLMPKENP